MPNLMPPPQAAPTAFFQNDTTVENCSCQNNIVIDTSWEADNNESNVIMLCKIIISLCVICL